MTIEEIIMEYCNMTGVFSSDSEEESEGRACDKMRHRKVARIDKEETACDNCQRRHVNILQRDAAELRHLSTKTYYLIKCPTPIINLCHECSIYLAKGSQKCHWPAMVWSFLSSTNDTDVALCTLSLTEKWKYIPSTWRRWWIKAVECDQITLDTPEPEVVDVTSSKVELHSAIEALKWLELGKAMDKYLAVPTVRCPWGCSEFLHDTNTVPYEDLLLARSNFCFPSTSDAKKQSRHWTDSCRPDYPRSFIPLEQEAFICQPSITVDETGVNLLCCKHHSYQTKERYVHVPENPTGSLFTPASNQYAPVVLRSRTLRKGRSNQYSDTYQTVQLQGGFDGIDSCYLSSHGNYHTSNSLSVMRDSLSIQGRDDVFHHVEQLCCSSDTLTYLPKANVDEKIHISQELYPDLSVSARHLLSGSTYVSLPDAISLQEYTYNEKPINLSVRDEDDPDVVGEVRLFEPPWPLKVIRVHPYDVHGEKFVGVPDPGESFSVWSLLACVLCVDDFWPFLTESLSTNTDPQGYLLSLAWNYVQFGRGGERHKKNSIFSFTKPKKKKPTASSSNGDTETLLPTLEARLNIATGARFPWPAHKVTVQEGSFDPDACNTDIAIVYYDKNDMFSYTTENEAVSNLWQAVLVVAQTGDIAKRRTWNGKIMARHGSDPHTAWWIQQSAVGRQANFRQCEAGAVVSLDGVRMAVYKRKDLKMSEEFQRRYLECLGGQSIIYCAHHATPLITTTNKTTRCVCNKSAISQQQKEWELLPDERCQDSAEYMCLQKGCPVAVCQNSYRHLIANAGRNCFALAPSYCRETKLEYISASDPSRSGGNAIYCPANTHYNDGRHRKLDFTDEESESDNNYLDESELENVGPTEGHEFLLDLIDYGADQDEDEELEREAAQGPFYIQTAAQAQEVLTAALDAEKEIASAPLHVILNRQGHCLIRRNAKLRLVRQHKSFFQRVVARCKGRSIPLVYAEGSLFPDIFYYSTPTGAILGALPTALWTDRRTLAKYGIASMRSHACQRIQDGALLTSTDSRYHFTQMDCLVNIALRGEDARLVLHRGFAERQSPNEGVTWRQQEGTEELYEDDVENHSNVHKLSRLIDEDGADFFYTQSCNQKTCRGLGILREWISSEEAVEKVQDKYDLTYEEAKECIRTSAAPYVQRSWNAFFDLWMRYIINSPEQPLGPIDWAWFRKEFQDMTGNVSHGHSVLKSLYDTSTKEGEERVLSLIRGSLADLLHYKELCKLKEEGHIDSLDYYEEILKDAIKYLTHKCGPRCQVPKKDADGNTTWVCKRPDNSLISSAPGEHTTQDVAVEHSEAAMEIMQELGFATGNIITESKLRMRRHIPKCCKEEGKFSPTNGELFVKFPSSQNLQQAGGHCISSYLAGYVASVDKVARVNLRGPTKFSPSEFRAEHESLGNTKIASVKNYHKTKDKTTDTKEGNKKHHSPPVGRPVTQMEALTVIQGDALVTSTRHFLFVPTCPREFRAAVPSLYVRSTCRPQDLQAVRAVTGQTVRLALKFPTDRLFTNHQMEVIQDELEAPLKTDQVTCFSMRPPELVFVDNLVDYTRWFVRKSVCPLFDPQKSMKYLRENLHADVTRSQWLDGFNYHIAVRRAAVVPLYKLAKSRYYAVANTNVRRPTIHILMLLAKLAQLMDGTYSLRRSQERLEVLSTLFVHSTSSQHLPVVWWTPIFPRRKTAFLVQLLLCEGNFETEYEIMLQGDIRSAFRAAGLLDDNALENSYKRLFSTYVIKHLRLSGGGISRFDLNLLQAKTALQNVFFPNEDAALLLFGTPSVLYTAMTQETNYKIEAYLATKKQTLVDAVYKELDKCGMTSVLPTVASIMAARDQPLDPESIMKFFPPPKHPNQTDASYKEQTSLMSDFRTSVAQYKSGATKHRNFVIVGGPGVGKTTVAMICTLYCLSMGLNGITTSIVSDRSKELGGIHFHQLISLRGNSNNYSPGRTAEMALCALYRNPEAIAFIKSVDFLNLDELGPFSAENLAILDMVWRYIRGSSEYMGGIFVFCTMDHLQLLPFHGTPVLLSMYAITEFTFVRLLESVRAANDPVLRDIIRLTRLAIWTEEDEQSFIRLLEDHCTFLDNFDDPRIPNDAVYVFGRKEPCRAAERILLERMKILHSDVYRVVSSYDEESTTGGNWHIASEGTKSRMDRKFKQRRELTLYPLARFEFTHVLKNKFNQGQLAILLEVPSDDDIIHKHPIEVYKAPSGVKYFPPDETCTKEWLEANGWVKVGVPYDMTPTEQIGRGLQGRRTQYGMKPRVSSTIHACMGSTLPSIVTAVTTLPGMSYDFSLWEAALVVVLLSRTRAAKHMFFVGDKRATVKHLLEVLKGRQNRFLRYITALLDKLCGERDDVPPIFQQPTVFRPKDTILTSVPGVYLLVSTRQPAFTYIGETPKLSERLQTHNTGQGPDVTANYGLLPYAMFAYVVGFQDKGERLKFESTWKLAAKRRSNLASSGNGLVVIARDLVLEFNTEHKNHVPLRLVQCGELVTE